MVGTHDGSPSADRGAPRCHNAGMEFDLVIRGATVVTPGHQEAADIGIADGKTAQIGGAMTGAREIAAGGLLAIPGGIDAHTHLVHQALRERCTSPIWVDDFWSGSRAAIAGGITTIANMTNPAVNDDGAEETPSAAIAREMAGAAQEAAVDWFLHPIFYEPGAAPGLAWPRSRQTAFWDRPPAAPCQKDRANGAASRAAAARRTRARKSPSPGRRWP